VYDAALQEEYQRLLLYRCPGRMEAGLQVSMPYCRSMCYCSCHWTALDITTAIWSFTLVNAVGLALYLVRFTRGDCRCRLSSFSCAYGASACQCGKPVPGTG